MTPFSTSAGPSSIPLKVEIFATGTPAQIQSNFNVWAVANPGRTICNVLIAQNATTQFFIAVFYY
jgi:hypothetical protein